MESLGPWDGARPPLDPLTEPKAAAARAGALVVSTWKHLLDRGSMQDGDIHLAATARAAVARGSTQRHTTPSSRCWAKARVSP
jgi:NADH-quinone oxidoreductase subunit G